MTLPKFRVEQHSQILGFAIIGYGVAAIIELIDPIFQTKRLSSLAGSGLSREIDFEPYLWPKVIFSVLLLVICLLSSIVIRNREINPRTWGLTLAVLIFGFFPLGTLLSVYILFYLFVIDTGDYGNESTVNAVHLNE